MPRQANAVDFWRGFALVTIFINHIPGIYYSRFTHFNVSLSDSAELFVFLAGWALRYMISTKNRPPGTAYLILRLGGRAVELYVAHIFITMMAIAMLAASATIMSNPLLLEWHNAAAVFYDPVPTHIGLSLLTHQLGYFNILPLYVVLMAMAPIFAVIDRFAPNAVLPLSLLIYFVTLVVPIDIPTWPVDGQWFLNPLAWQLVFVLGFVIAREDGFGEIVRRHIIIIRWFSLPIVIVGAYSAWNAWWPDPTTMPQPRLIFIVDKTYVTPLRLIQFLALCAAVSVTFAYIKRAAAPVVEFLSMLGRHSLRVFCVGSILSLTGQITRFIYQSNIVVDTLVVILGIMVLAVVAWLPEWREKIRTKGLLPPLQPS